MSFTEVNVTAPAAEYGPLAGEAYNEYFQAKNAELTEELRAAVEKAGKKFTPGRVYRYGVQHQTGLRLTARHP